jgi:antitoxin component YwqK of YwqJK toxin-antitoxin module
MEKRFYYISGELEEIINCINDKREGECKRYHKNGQLEEVSYWKNGKLNGEKKLFFKDGHLRRVSYWKDGEDITKQVLEKRELLERIKDL